MDQAPGARARPDARPHGAHPECAAAFSASPGRHRPGHGQHAPCPGHVHADRVRLEQSAEAELRGHIVQAFAGYDLLGRDGDSLVFFARKADGSTVSPVMPFGALREMSDVDLEALYVHLKGLTSHVAAAR